MRKHKYLLLHRDIFVLVHRWYIHPMTGYFAVNSHCWDDQTSMNFCSLTYCTWTLAGLICHIFICVYIYIHVCVFKYIWSFVTCSFPARGVQVWARGIQELVLPIACFRTWGYRNLYVGPCMAVNLMSACNRVSFNFWILSQKPRPDSRYGMSKK